MTSTSEYLVAPEGAESTLRTLDAAVRNATGHEAFPEGLWAALTRSPDRCLVLTDPAHTFGVVAFPSDSFQPSHCQLGATLAPGGDEAALSGCVGVAIAELARFEHLVAWIPGSDPRVLAALKTTGFRVDREQIQMRVPLPIAARPQWPTGVVVQPFRPGLDDAEWLRVNNRAFSNHAEQGGWIEATLQRRLAEPWFEPTGFLLASRDATLLGFCWTKVHEGRDESGDEIRERVGEIFVIGVDPDAQGIGLGRALVLGGLTHLAHDRACTEGLLYVAATNSGAVRLYESLGFSVSRRDAALILDRVAP